MIKPEFCNNKDWLQCLAGKGVGNLCITDSSDLSSC